MAATPYKVAMTVRNAQGQSKSFPLTVSDVSGAYALYPSGGSEIQLSSQAVAIVDFVVTSSPVDTTYLDVYQNGINTGYRIFPTANLATAYNRQIQSSPISVGAGNLIKFVQG